MKKKTAYLGVMLALALICSYVEVLIPFSIGIPGIKLGLANIVIVFDIGLYVWKCNGDCVFFCGRHAESDDYVSA